MPMHRRKMASLKWLNPINPIKRIKRLKWCVQDNTRGSRRSYRSVLPTWTIASSSRQCLTTSCFLTSTAPRCRSDILITGCANGIPSTQALPITSGCMFTERPRYQSIFSRMTLPYLSTLRRCRHCQLTNIWYNKPLGFVGLSCAPPHTASKTPGPTRFLNRPRWTCWSGLRLNMAVLAESGCYACLAIRLTTCGESLPTQHLMENSALRRKFHHWGKKVRTISVTDTKFSMLVGNVECSLPIIVQPAQKRFRSNDINGPGNNGSGINGSGNSTAVICIYCHDGFNRSNASR